MYLFVKKMLLFIAPIVLGIYPLDLFISNTLKKSHAFAGEIEVWEDIRKGDIDCDIAIYGTSRAWLQFNPLILKETLNKEVYNFGMDGHNFWLQYLRHIEFLKHNKKPETILISVDVFTLEKRKNLYQLEQFLPYMLWNDNVKKFTESYQGFQKTDYYIPFFRYAGKKTAILETKSIILGKHQSFKEYRKRGFKTLDLKWGEKNDVVNTDFGYTAIIDTQTLSLFEKFIQQCLQDEIRLVFVYAPEHVEGQRKINNREQVVNIYKKFSKKYNLLFLDYSKNQINRNKKYFYNSMHLNSLGSVLFSQKLAEDLKAQL